MKAEPGTELIEKQIGEVKEQVTDQVQETYQEIKPLVVRLARWGYAAKGMVYILVGFLALQAELSYSSPDVDVEEAFQALVARPLFGPIMLGLIAAGLAGYVIWRFVQAVIDPERRGNSFRGLLKRGVYIISGISYSGLVLSAAQILLGAGGPGGEESAEDWTARLLALSFGPWLVGLAGAGFLLAVLFHLYLAYSTSFKGKLSLHKMNGLEKKWAIGLGRIGFIARGIIYSVIGLFLIHAAIRYNPEDAGGFGEALNALAQRPFGPWMLTTVAAGLIAYGGYHLLIARHGKYIT